MLTDADFVQLSDALAREIGPDAVTTEPSDLGGHASDWSGLIGATPSSLSDLTKNGSETEITIRFLSNI